MKLVELAESGEEMPKAILARIKDHEMEISALEIQDEAAMENAQKWGSEVIEQSRQQEVIIEILDRLQTLQGTELHDLRIALSSKIKRVIDKIAMYPAGPWMPDEKLAYVKQKMSEDGIDEAGINHYLQQFTEEKRDDRYIVILFKNGMSLRLSKNHATPQMVSTSVEWYGELPEFWPTTRESYLASN